MAGEAGVNMLLPAVLVMAGHGADHPRPVSAKLRELPYPWHAGIDIDVVGRICNPSGVEGTDYKSATIRRHKMAIELDCPRCKHRLSVPSQKAGDYATCPRCKGRLWVPNPAAPRRPPPRPSRWPRPRRLAGRRPNPSRPATDCPSASGTRAGPHSRWERSRG